ncbi:MAG: hypothetical protein HXM98_00460 [Porphyromonadaceae bacterium]|jgi:hypothetical protein|nr:hypothetical protein [Porphyromonadaceae bacterium]
MRRVLDLKLIASAGGNLIINEGNYSGTDLKIVATASCEGKGTLMIKRVSRLSALDCQIIASANPGHVTFDFSEE